MQKRETFLKRFFPFIIMLVLSVISLNSDSLKLKVAANNANIKTNPEIGGENLTQVNAGTILMSVEKQGEWYKVRFNKEGNDITGYIHEMLVEVVREDPEFQDFRPPFTIEKSQDEIINEVKTTIDDSKKLIREEQGIDSALESLRPLIPKLFRISDLDQQKQLAAQIYFWIGLGYAAIKDEYRALKEIKNMFEVDHSYALEISRNIYDPNIAKIISLAEKEYLGLIQEYYLTISTNPSGASITLNGQDAGLTPKTINTDSPKFHIKIEKKGFHSIEEEIFLVAETSEKEYILQKKGRLVRILSEPSGAKIYLDGKNTGKETNTDFPFIAFGTHTLKLEKKHYHDWHEEFDINPGKEPIEVNAALKAREYNKLDQWGKINSHFFESPTGITLDKDGNLYIVDESPLKVKKFSPEGKFESSLAENKRELNRLKSPFGITVDDNGYIFVTDRKKNCIMKFNKNGTFLLKWGKEGSGDTDLNDPLGIAVDSRNHIYVADSGNHKIKIFDHNGIFMKSWGKKGSSPGNFLYPAGIFIDSNDLVYITDQNRLQKFSSGGKVLKSWGEKGDFNRPMGLFIGDDKCIYIADTYNNRIKKIDAGGDLIIQWGNRETEDFKLNFPTGIAVNSEGLVYVVEKNYNRVQVFGYKSQINE